MASTPVASREPAHLEQPESRRTFFRRVIRWAASVIGIGLAVPLAGYVASPALRQRESHWADIGSVADLPIGVPTQLEYVMSLRDGYMESRVRKAVWAVKRENGEVIAYTAMCTHLGCGYTWDSTDGRFECPCHGSKFSVDGEVIGGPAPRPLDRLPSRIENGRLLIVYKEFKAGLPRQVEL